MRGFLLLCTSYLTQILSLLCVCLIVVPLLFPLLGLLCGMTFLSTFFSSYLGRKLEKEASYSRGLKNKLLTGLHKGNQRAKRMSLAAVALSFFLYGILRVHTSVCYINSLDKGLEPTREQFRKFLGPKQEKFLKVEKEPRAIQK